MLVRGTSRSWGRDQRRSRSRRAIWSMALVGLLLVLVACSGAPPAPTAAPSKPTEAPKPAAPAASPASAAPAPASPSAASSPAASASPGAAASAAQAKPAAAAPVLTNSPVTIPFYTTENDPASLDFFKRVGEDFKKL